MTDFEIIAAMRLFGGGFVSRLADCWMHADESNQARLRHAFWDYWAEYDDLARRHAEREKQKASVPHEG